MIYNEVCSLLWISKGQSTKDVKVEMTKDKAKQSMTMENGQSMTQGKGSHQAMRTKEGKSQRRTK